MRLSRGLISDAGLGNGVLHTSRRCTPPLAGVHGDARRSLCEAPTLSEGLLGFLSLTHTLEAAANDHHC